MQFKMGKKVLSIILALVLTFNTNAFYLFAEGINNDNTVYEVLEEDVEEESVEDRLEEELEVEPEADVEEESVKEELESENEESIIEESENEDNKTTVEETTAEETEESISDEEVANIATNSEMSIEDISLDLDLDIEEKEIEDEIYGIPSQGTIIFTLPSELVEEETARFMSASGGTISEDGTTLTMTVGVPTAGSMAGKVSVNPPSVNISCDRNRGLTFNNAWNGDGVTIKPGQQNTLDFSKKSSYSFSPDYKDERGTLTLKIKETDLDKFEFELDQGEGKKVKVESKSSLSTKYYYSYKPKIKLADDKYEVMFGSYSWQGQLAKEKQDTTITATYKIVPYKVIYKFNNSDDNQNMTLEGCSPGYLEYTQNFNDEDKAVLKKVISKPDNYFRKLVAWIDDETGEEYLPGDTITHTGVRNVYLTSKVESYEPVVVYFESEYRDEPLIQYVEKGTPIGWMSVSGPEGYEVKYWYQNDRNVPFDIENTPITTPITLRAVYGPCDYDIYYEKNGGEFVEGYEPPIKRSYIGSVTLPTAEDIKKEDCYFDGWYENSQLTGDRVTVIPNNTLYHRTYYAKWRVGYYPITLNENGGTYVNGYTKPVKRAYGYTFVLPTANDIKKEGNAFGGWYNNPSFTGVPYDEISATSEEEYVLYLKWIEGVYEYHYDLGSGGSFNNGTSKDGTRTYAQELTLASSANVVREGYTFVRWDLKDDDGNVLGTNATKIEANTGKNVNIVAVWTENEYSLSFNPNGGTYATGYTLPSNKRMYSVAVTLPTSAQISKKGFTFEGWFENENFTGTAVTAISANTVGDKAYYAKWTENSYTIDYNIDGGSVVAGNSLVTSRLYSESLTLLTGAELEKIGYGFDGWFESPTFTGSLVTTIAANTDKNYVLYAKWTARKYNINYYDGGATYRNGYNKVTKRDYGVEVTLPTSADISKEGCSFVAWYDNENFTGSPITKVDANLSRDINVYLKWNKATFNITYDLNGGSYINGYVSIDTRKYSQAVVLPTASNIHKVGYTFAGWYDNDKFTGSPITTIPANTNKDVTIYCNWKENEYLVSYTENGGKYKTGYKRVTKRLYSTEIILPTENDIEKTGHTFAGWYESEDFSGSPVTKVPSGTSVKKEVYLKWVPNTYNIVYNLNGGSIRSGEVNSYTYGVGATLPTDVFKNDYEKFIGWFENSSFSGTVKSKISTTDQGDKEYFAKFGEVHYVKFDAGEGSGSMAIKPVELGVNFTVPECEFTHESKVFDKWESSDGKTYTKGKTISLTSNITLTALWKELKKATYYVPMYDSGTSRGSSSGGSSGTITLQLDNRFDPNRYTWEGTNQTMRAISKEDGSYAINEWRYMIYNGNAGWYFLGEDGHPITQWRVIGNYVYYFEPAPGNDYGKMYTGVRVVDGKIRLFSETGQYLRDVQ